MAVFTQQDARRIGDALKVDWKKIDFEQFQQGLEIELEHGSASPGTNVTNDDELFTGKIALAHLNEIGDYYTRLAKMEAEAEGKPIPKS